MAGLDIASDWRCHAIEPHGDGHIINVIEECNAVQG
jgi:hypothetical protein